MYLCSKRKKGGSETCRAVWGEGGGGQGDVAKKGKQ